MTFTGGVKNKKPMRFIVPQRNVIRLDMGEKREAKLLGEKLANENENLKKITNFEQRESKAREIALNMIKERKRKLIENEKKLKQVFKNTGLESDNENENARVIAPKPPSPPKARPIDARKLAQPVPLKGVRKPGQMYQPPTVGVKTGKRAILLTNSPPLKAPLIERGNYSLNMKDRLKIGRKLCVSHGKEEIQKFLKNSGVVVTKKMTKEELCKTLKNNIFK